MAFSYLEGYPRKLTAWLWKSVGCISLANTWKLQQHHECSVTEDNFLTRILICFESFFEWKNKHLWFSYSTHFLWCCHLALKTTLSFLYLVHLIEHEHFGFLVKFSTQNLRDVFLHSECISWVTSNLSSILLFKQLCFSGTFFYFFKYFIESIHISSLMYNGSCLIWVLDNGG